MKKYYIILCCVIIISFLGGCLKRDVAPKKTTTGKIELVYYKLYDDEDVMKPLIQQYVATHPNVNITYRKFTDPKEYEDLIINELAEGQGPDIFSAPNYWFLRHQKKITPLPDSMMSVKNFENTFVSVAQNDLVLRDVNDNAQKIFGLPLSVDTLALYYNKADFDDKIPSRGKPAATWEELKDDVFKLSKKDNSFERFELAGVALGRGDNISRAIDILYLLMLQYKTNFYNSNVSNAIFAKQQSTDIGNISINPASEALNLFTSFALPTNKNYSWNSYLADPKSDLKEIETFAKGKVAMIFGYSYLYDQIISEIKVLQAKGVQTIDPKVVKISAVPQVIDPSVSTDKRVAYANYYAETVSRTSQHPQEAWDFLMFLTSKDNVKYYSDKTHRPTSRRDMINDQIKDPTYGVFAEQVGYSESFPIYDYYKYTDIFSAAIDSVLATTSPVDAIRVAETKVNDLLPPGGLIPPEPKTNQLKAVPAPTASTAGKSTTNATSTTK